jgi:hypothetical protein
MCILVLTGMHMVLLCDLNTCRDTANMQTYTRSCHVAYSSFVLEEIMRG